MRRWERSVSRVSRLSFRSPFVTQSLTVPPAHLPQLGGRLLTSPPTSLRSAHGTDERSDVRRERERHATRHSSSRSRFVWRVSLFTTSPISYLVHRSVSLLSSLVHDGCEERVIAAEHPSQRPKTRPTFLRLVSRPFPTVTFLLTSSQSVNRVFSIHISFRSFPLPSPSVRLTE